MDSVELLGNRFSPSWSEERDLVQQKPVLSNRFVCLLLCTAALLASCSSNNPLAAAQHNIAAQNVAGIANSPLECKTAANSALLLQVSAAMDRVKVGELINSNVLVLLQRFIANNNIIFAPSQYPDLEAAYSDAKNQTLWQLLQQNNISSKDNLAMLDKNTQDIRYSAARNIDIQGGNMTAITRNWVAYMQSAKDINKLLANHKVATFLALFVFDTGIINIIATNNQLETLAQLRREFFDGPLGNKQKKAALQADLLTKRGADVLLVNQTFPEFTQQLQQRQFVVFASKKSSESLIALHCGKWNASTAQEITLKLKKPDPDGGKSAEEMQAKNIGIKVQDSSNRIYHFFSLHSNPSGEWSLPILRAVVQAVADKDYVVLFHSANTHVKGAAKGKADATQYMKQAFQLGFQPAYGADPTSPITYAKERTRLQAQTNEADLAISGRGDFVLVRGPQILERQIDNNLLNNNNAADHKPLYVTLE